MIVDLGLLAMISHKYVIKEFNVIILLLFFFFTYIAYMSIVFTFESFPLTFFMNSPSIYSSFSACLLHDTLSMPNDIVTNAVKAILGCNFTL